MGRRTKVKGSDSHDPQIKPKDYCPGLGGRLRLAREGFGSVHKFAAESGFAAGTISGAENEENNLSLPALMQWCKAAKVSPGTVLNPDIDEFSLLVLAARAKIGRENLKWLAGLTKEAAKIAMNRARAEIRIYEMDHPDKPVTEAEILSLQKSE